MQSFQVILSLVPIKIAKVSSLIWRTFLFNFIQKNIFIIFVEQRVKSNEQRAKSKKQ